MEIDNDAPAVTRQEREVAMAPERVFDLIVDVAGWPRWQPAVTKVDVRFRKFFRQHFGDAIGRRPVIHHFCFSPGAGVFVRNLI